MYDTFEEGTAPTVGRVPLSLSVGEGLVILLKGMDFQSKTAYLDDVSSLAWGCTSCLLTATCFSSYGVALLEPCNSGTFSPLAALGHRWTGPKTDRWPPTY